MNRTAHDLPQRGKATRQGLRNLGREDQFSLWQIPVKRICDIIQKHGTDDAPSPPDAGNGCQIKAPAIGIRRRRENAKPLGIGQQARGQKRLGQNLGRVIKRANSAAKDRLGPLACGFFRGPAPCPYRRLDHAGRLPQTQRLDHGPAPSAFLTRRILDHIHHGMPGLGIGIGQELRRDLDQIGFERSKVPGGKKRADLSRRQGRTIAQQAVDFGNDLHIGIFDAIMHRLYEMPRPVRPQTRDAGDTIIAGCDGRQNRFQLRPAMITAAQHHRGAVPRARLAARYAQTHEMQIALCQLRSAAAGVVEIGIAAVDHGITGAEQRDDLIQHGIHRRARGDHEEDDAGGVQRRDKRLELLMRVQPDRQIARLCHEGRDPVHLAIGHGDVKPVLGDVQRQGAAHGAQPIDANLRHAFPCYR